MANNTNLWHQRLGHISEKGLQVLSKKGLLNEDKIQTMELCEYCVLGKSKRVSFSEAKHTTTRPLEYIHSDIWRPSRTATHGGAKYFMKIIDDFTRRVWTFTMKTKDEAAEKFKVWLLSVENKTDQKVKHIRTDNGLEYLSDQFNRLCKERGITRHMTVPGTPQQNGVVERMNRTLLERVRCMILSAKLPKTFWGEALSTATYLINRCPCSAIDFKTPMESWSGKPSDYKWLKVFGCLAYAHIKQDKLDARALRCIFIGYPEGTKGYKVWNLETKGPRCFNTRNVIFDESKMGYADKENKPEIGIVEPEGSHFEVEPQENVHTIESVDHNEIEELSSRSPVREESNMDTNTYTLARDRQRRQIKPPKKCGQADLLWYALITA